MLNYFLHLLGIRGTQPFSTRVTNGITVIKVYRQNATTVLLTVWNLFCNNTCVITKHMLYYFVV